MASTFFETFAKFQADARRDDRMASAATISVQGTVFRTRSLINESRELIDKADEILERDHRMWRPG